MTHPAFDLAARGLHLTRIPSGVKKHAHDAWQNSPRMTPAELAAAVAERSNFGVLTGEPSNCFVLDIDTKHPEGVASMRSLVEKHGSMPPTLVVNTPSGGFHYYFQMPGFDVRNSQGFRKADGTVVGLAPGLDLRGTGGYVVAPGSWTYASDALKQHEGWYLTRTDAPIGRAPDWLREWLWERHEKRTRGAETASAAVDTPYDPARADDYAAYERSAVNRELDRLAALNRPWTPGSGWDITTFEVACSLLEIAHASWSQLTPQEVEILVLERAPSDGVWGPQQIQEKLASARTRVAGKARPAPALRPRADASWDAPAPGPAAPAASPASQEVVIAGDGVDVSNPANAVEWLRENLGRGALSGIFRRDGDVVFTPQIGEQGYIEPRAQVGRRVTSTHTASIVVLDQYGLSARIQSRLRVTKTSEVQGPDGQRRRITGPALFPPAAALHAVKAPDDMLGLRELGGVVHTPTFRPDGSLIGRPGYDDETGLLFLPTGGQPPTAVPEAPTAEDVGIARKWLDYMLQDFSFVGIDDKANYIGLALTPLLRAVVPPPYKLGVIEAHQPGSGKSYLARALTSIHSGSVHPEFPSEEAEVVKTISAMLDVSTGAVMVFDNVTGILHSSALAGLLTSPTYSARRLGTGKMIEANNDRMWLITANNAVLGGDLGRRSLRVRLDPGIPNPEARTGFVIADFETWVLEHRGELLWSLLVLVRNWVALGSPVPDQIRGDSYGRWAAVVGSILAAAGIPGTFDDPRAAGENVDPETEEWASFFAAIHALHGESPWTTKAVLAQVGPPIEGFTPTQAMPMSFDILPGSLLANRAIAAPVTLSRALGKYLQLREGRWFGQYSVRRLPTTDRSNTALWRVTRHGG